MDPNTIAVETPAYVKRAWSGSMTVGASWTGVSTPTAIPDAQFGGQFGWVGEPSFQVTSVSPGGGASVGYLDNVRMEQT